MLNVKEDQFRKYILKKCVVLISPCLSTNYEAVTRAGDLELINWKEHFFLQVPYKTTKPIFWHIKHVFEVRGNSFLNWNLRSLRWSYIVISSNTEQSARDLLVFSSLCSKHVSHASLTVSFLYIFHSYKNNTPILYKNQLLFLSFYHYYMITKFRFYRRISINRIGNSWYWQCESRILKGTNHRASRHPSEITLEIKNKEKKSNHYLLSTNTLLIYIFQLYVT